MTTHTYPEHVNALLTRSVGDFQVDACLMPLVDLTGIQVRGAGESRWVSVEKSKLLDAYWHPALYLNDEALAAVGLVKSQVATDEPLASRRADGPVDWTPYEHSSKELPGL